MRLLIGADLPGSPAHNGLRSIFAGALASHRYLRFMINSLWRRIPIEMNGHVEPLHERNRNGARPFMTSAFRFKAIYRILR